MFDRVLLFLLGTIIARATDLSVCKIKNGTNGPLAGTIPQIQTGTVKIVNQNLISRYTTFNVTFSQPVAINYELAISVQNIYSFIPNQGIDFQATRILRPTFFTGILVMDGAAKWSWASICYMMSQRSDFAAGNLVINNDQLVNPASNFSDVVTSLYVPPKSGLNSPFVYAVPFVSGMRTFDYSLSFSFIDCQYNATNSSLLITIQTRYQKYPLEFLSISYIIFNMASQLQITSLFNISFIPANVNTFLGVTSYQGMAHLFNQSSTGAAPRVALSATPVQVEAFNAMFGIDGIIVQTQMNIDLLYRPLAESVSTTYNCVSKSTCQSKGGYMVYSQIQVFQIVSSCQVCAINMFFSNITNKCECFSEYVMVNNSCINISLTCKNNEVYSKTQKACVCAPLCVNISGKCVSIIGYCPAAGQIYFNGKCIKIVYNQFANSCPLGYIMVNSICVQKKICTPPMVLNTSTNLCECPVNTTLVDNACQDCSINQTWLNNRCVCKDQYFRIKGVCLKCSQNAYFDGKNCVCLRLFSGNGFNCTPTSSLKSTAPGQAPSGVFSSTGGIIKITNNP